MCYEPNELEEYKAHLLIILAKCRKPGVPWSTYNQDVQMAHYFDVKNKLLWIFFQGSKSLADWKTNFDFPIKPYRNMPDMWFAHRGFLKAYKGVRPAIKSLIEKYQPEKVSVAGYSQGAALTVLCHEDIMFRWQHRTMTVRSYAFACPRVFSWFWQPSSIEKRLVGLSLILLKKDIVTWLPFVWMGFIHKAGLILRIGKAGLPGIKGHQTENYASILQEVCDDA